MFNEMKIKNYENCRKKRRSIVIHYQDNLEVDALFFQLKIISHKDQQEQIIFHFCHYFNVQNVEIFITMSC